ncbi:MAG: hypothetical protein WCW14_04700 [Candidatus Paceibacterota bacterium]|jgi:hypothetical protein
MFDDNPFKRAEEMGTSTEQYNFKPKPEVKKGDEDYLASVLESMVLPLIEVSPEQMGLSTFEYIRSIALEALSAEIKKDHDSPLNETLERINRAQTLREIVDELKGMPPPKEGVEREQILKMIAEI